MQRKAIVGNGSNTAVHQELLLDHLKNIFPHSQGHVNPRKKSALKYQATDSYVELDVFFPSLSLCFEFQDSYHYVTTWYAHKSMSIIQQKDIEKRNLAQTKGITYIEIPCWWDGELGSLQSTIGFERDDLVSPVPSPPIPLNPPINFFHSRSIPGIGEMMLASFPVDVSFADTISTTNVWWIGEKYDGIRFCWNSDLCDAYSRTGNVIPLLPFVEKQMPQIFIDGEFWFGRGQYSMLPMLVKGSTNLVQWHQFRIVAFDVPAIEFRKTEFEHRYEELLTNISFTHAFIHVTWRSKGNKAIMVKTMAQGIMREAGEGLVLRRPRSLYEPGRSSDLLKLKASLEDQEGIVIVSEVQKELILKLPNGKTCTVPAAQVETTSWPTIGDIVSFSYESHARRDVPVVPRVFRIRTDLSWEDVIRNFAEEQEFQSERKSDDETYTVQPLYHWNDKTMREFLENFARSRDMDPLNPETWYSTSRDNIQRVKGGNTVLDKFDGYSHAVLHLFSDIGLDKSRFSYAPGYWVDIRNRRYFFEKFAQENKFDPQIPDNWYKQSKDSIMARKGYNMVLSYHNYSLPKALVAAFPNIGLDPVKLYFGNLWRDSENTKKTYELEIKAEPVDPFPGREARRIMFGQKGMLELFPNLPKDQLQGVWNDKENRKKFFYHYAKVKGFDPLIAENWYSISLQGASSILSYYHGSVSKALIDIFPNIGLDKSKFQYQGMYSKVENRRKFFENYAQQNNFDPLNPDHWYNQPKGKILATQGANRVLFFHNRQVSQALCDLFSNIKLDQSKFKNSRLSNKYMWVDPNKRRKFFENYAKDNSFNPFDPNMWYKQSSEKIMASKGAAGVMVHHKTVPKALVSLFPDIGLDLSKFHHQHVWGEKENRRKFFENYALETGFDSLIAANWYSQPREQIKAIKGASGVLSYHNLSVSRALMELFPEIGLEKAKFNLKSPG